MWGCGDERHTLFVRIFTLLGVSSILFFLLILKDLNLPAKMITNIRIQITELRLVQGNVKHSVNDLRNNPHNSL